MAKLKEVFQKKIRVTLHKHKYVLFSVTIGYHAPGKYIFKDGSSYISRLFVADIFLVLLKKKIGIKIFI